MPSHKIMRTHGKYRVSPSKKAGISVLVLLLALALPVHGLAEQDSTEELLPDISSPQDMYKLPTITVTADKRAADVQKTTSAITVMSGTKLEDAKIDSVAKVMQHIPNMNLSPFVGGVSQMSIRGITTSPGTSTSPIIMYVDGVPVDTYFNLDAPLMDIERVEVLRGPQSSIYGKNAMGGVINVISRKPGNEWHGGILTEYGSYDTYKFNASISGPIIEDRLAFALSGSHSYSGGYMDNDRTSKSNKERSERVKGQLRFTPSDDAEFNFHVNYTARRDGFSNLVLGNHATLDSIADPDDYLKSNILNLALTSSLTFDPMIVETITTYRDEDLDYAVDMGMVYNPLMGTDEYDTGRKNKRREFTQELRFRSPDDKEGVKWLAGLYGGYTDMNIRSVYSDAKMTNYPLGGGIFADGYLWQDQPSREYTQDYAAFGEMTIPVTDAFKVTAALRGQYTHKKIHVQNTGMLMEFPSAGVSIPGASMSKTESDSWTELLPKLNLSYQLTDDVMLYAGVNRSFIPGGFNNVSATGIDMTYDSQTAWNYEIGAKTEWLDKRLMLNLALFYSDLDDLQVFKYDPQYGYLSSNAGSAKSYGAELDAVARIMPGLDAEFSFGYTWARLTDYQHQGADYSGKKVPFTPEYTASFALQYNHDCGFVARGEVLHYGSMYWTEDNKDERGDITLLNARIGYEFDKFGVYVYGNNLGNEKYLSYYSPASNLGMMARPREVGMQLQYRF